MLFFVFIYYEVSNENKNNKATDKAVSYSQPKENMNSAEYSLIKVNSNSKIKFLADVRIDKKLNDNQLKQIAVQIEDDVGVKSERGSIAFYLPEMRTGSGAWAAVDFTPEISIRIIGQSIEEEQEIMAGIDNIHDYEGLWSDNFQQGAMMNRISKDKSLGFVIEIISPSDPKPSEFADQLKKTIQNGRVIYKDIEHPGQYFLVEDNGDLSVYDNDGYTFTYKKLK